MPPGWRRSLQLVLAAAWLTDGVLQLQPSMFSPGARSLPRVLAATAAGNPQPVAVSIRWAAGVIGAHSAAADIILALVQVLLGLGIAWRPSARVAMALSVPWALGVWWFGEGLGGVLHGGGAPVLGGPGAVLVYAVLAVVLWPDDARDGGPRSPAPPAARFAAAGALGGGPAKAIWAALWSAMAALSLLGGARAPSSISAAVAAVAAGEPGWLASLDRHEATLASGRGLVVAVVLAVACAVVAAGVYLPPRPARCCIGLGILVSLVIWVAMENFGMVLAGGATDTSSGPVLVVLALAYWPYRAEPAEPAVLRAQPAETSAELMEVG